MATSAQDGRLDRADRDAREGFSAQLPAQRDLFELVIDAYVGADTAVANDELYRRVGQAAGIEPAAWDEKRPIGRAGQMHSPLKRKVRWYQQTLKNLGVLEPVDGEAGRGRWRLTSAGRAKYSKLTPAAPRRVLLGFSTDLGLALWASFEHVFPALGEPIHLSITSPPYPLAVERAYGNVSEAGYVDWICQMLEPIVRHLAPGGSVVLNISNDIFMPKSPARSLYRERLVLALHERLGLFKMDEIPWINRSKPPGPLQWASLSRQQLNVAWEPIYWFTNDPHRCLADNRRVLLEHTERHKRLLAAGGEQRTARYGDGAYRLRPGSYGRPTAGRIPKNVIEAGHACPDKQAVRRLALDQGLPTHGAAAPVSIGRQLVEFLTRPGDLVVDQCAGWFNFLKAAELSGRRWLGTELMGEHVLGAASRFRSAPGFRMVGEWAK